MRVITIYPSLQSQSPFQVAVDEHSWKVLLHVLDESRYVDKYRVQGIDTNDLKNYYLLGGFEKLAVD